MSEAETPINYFDVDLPEELNQPIRVSHAVGSISPPREIVEAVEEDEDDKLLEKLEVEIRNRKRIMQGLDEEIQLIQEKIEELGSGEERE